MNTLERIPVILRIVELQPEIGKTAIMKCIYLLQTIKDLPLKYHYEIYTYGPYSSSVMDEIDYARQNGLINVSVVNYPSGKQGYSIVCNEDGKEEASKSSIVSKYSSEIKSIVDEFGNMQASELEVLSTIVFVDRMCSDKRKSNICDLVNKIKSKYSKEFICEKYDYMKSKKYI